VPLRGVAAAVTFLTRIRVPHPAQSTDPGPPDLGPATPYFPLVGALVGAIGAAVYWLATLLWPQPVAVVLAIAATVLTTGALHEDALADFADGFGGGTTPDRVLSIMKDSRVGSYGVVALTLALLAKLTALSVLPTRDVILALIAAHTLSRYATLPLMASLPYVRSEGGTGAPFVGTITPARIAVATAFTLAILIATIGIRTIPVLLTATLLTALLAVYSRRRIGGITGDVLGATAQLVEVATYLVLAAHISMPG
jgi:adenosylcobinamide-GDP ribazoletransferase